MKSFQKRKIKKAIFPVGGLGTRFLPATKALPKEMLPVLDKPLIQYAIEEAKESGIEEFIFITGRGKSAIEDYFDHSVELELSLKNRNKTSYLNMIQEMILEPGSVAYVRQQEPLGLGHAIWCGRHLIKDEPVAVILADDLIKSKKGCLKQMIENWNGGNMVALSYVDKVKVSSYGIIEPGKIENNKIHIKDIVEKPSQENAPSQYGVVGRYILEPEIFSCLSSLKKGKNNEVQLTDCLSSMIGKFPFYGFLFSGTRFDCGTKLEFIEANISYALDNSEIKNELVNWITKHLRDGYKSE
ncbi:MAG: UTP--glucose-1-phosphate uridylyltransferase [Rickettsiales bacterium]|nr:UTP--glucose-1-phosphate uridylyltransferase [Rickettsiales bacterium]OUW05489.1 MAG: UTP--glucose-1-phosphate uridylyltransferase [Betaproteobacteria bacterium TMED156]